MGSLGTLSLMFLLQHGSDRSSLEHDPAKLLGSWVKLIGMDFAGAVSKGGMLLLHALEIIFLLITMLLQPWAGSEGAGQVRRSQIIASCCG